MVFPLPIDMFANVGRVLERFAQTTTPVFSEEGLPVNGVARNGASALHHIEKDPARREPRVTAPSGQVYLTFWENVHSCKGN